MSDVKITKGNKDTKTIIYDLNKFSDEDLWAALETLFGIVSEGATETDKAAIHMARIISEDDVSMSDPYLCGIMAGIKAYDMATNNGYAIEDAIDNVIAAPLDKYISSREDED